MGFLDVEGAWDFRCRRGMGFLDVEGAWDF